MEENMNVDQILLTVPQVEVKISDFVNELDEALPEDFSIEEEEGGHVFILSKEGFDEVVGVLRMANEVESSNNGGAKFCLDVFYSGSQENSKTCWHTLESVSRFLARQCDHIS